MNTKKLGVSLALVVALAGAGVTASLASEANASKPNVVHVKTVKVEDAPGGLNTDSDVKFVAPPKGKKGPMKVTGVDKAELEKELSSKPSPAPKMEGKPLKLTKISPEEMKKKMAEDGIKGSTQKPTNG